MSFEPTVLKEVAARTEVSIVQLIEKKGRPADLVSCGRPDEVPRSCARPPASPRSRSTPTASASTSTWSFPRDDVGSLERPGELAGRRRAPAAADRARVDAAFAENRFLPQELRSDDRPGPHGNLVAEARMFLEAGVDGLITDHPDLVLAARAEHLTSPARLLKTELLRHKKRGTSRQQD
jgi:glycerophosphoryl diester phosphodiesterase